MSIARATPNQSHLDSRSLRSRAEQDGHNQSCHPESDRELGHHAETDTCPDAEPVTWIIRGQQAHEEKGDHHPPQEVKGHVLDERSGCQRDRGDVGSDGSQHLGGAFAAHVALP